MDARSVFVTGGTGYIGRPLIAALLDRGYAVHALVRPGSEAKLPRGALQVFGNALDPSTFAAGIPPNATVVHLVGTPHPSPAKAAEFRRVDLPSIRATTTAAQQATARHIVYVSVAHPAPIMRAYIAVRQEGESLVEATGIPATILRPWYVLGPGHRWPYLLIPIYAALRWLPATRAGAERLGLVTRDAMIAALVRAIEAPPAQGVRRVGVPEIRRTTFDTSKSISTA
ncbi:MAG TPA: NAD(P)H-binding protein [Vicinamibacterales bacterium]|nr:NAD(P)H-binding protein [Vicinamibacterales bacterium]